jgi:hypothetical protein
MLAQTFLIVAMVLCIIQAFVGRPSPAIPNYPAWLPHFGWLGMAFFFASLIFVGGRI